MQSAMCYLRENAPSHRVKNYYGKKVWTVNAKHVEWVQCEHVNIPGHIVQLETQINELKKLQQNNKNRIKLEKLQKQLSKEKKIGYSTLRQSSSHLK